MSSPGTMTAARMTAARPGHPPCQGETPSRIWTTDKHGNGDPAARARRVLAARRRSRQQPPEPGPVPAQATG
jgi:hypothetical protein